MEPPAFVVALLGAESTGKTTLATAICNDIGATPLIINASLNNSIDDIRTNVTQYATSVSVLGGPKVVVLDEAERLSTAAQESLKGLMEACKAIDGSLV